MKEDMVTMSTREIERLRIVHKVTERRLTQVKAAEMMGVTDRQVRRILQRVRERGDRGILHGNRGRPSPRRITKEKEERIIGFMKKRYSDFGPWKARRVLEVTEAMIAERDNNILQIELSVPRTTTDGVSSQVKSRIGFPYIRSH